MTIDIRLLGPVELAVDGTAMKIGGDRTMTLFAALAIDIGHAVPVDRLVVDVWAWTGEDSTPSPRKDKPASVRITAPMRVVNSTMTTRLPFNSLSLARLS